MSNEHEPWHDLPQSLANLLEPLLPEVTRETLVAIRREVPDYDRPLEGEFGEAVRTGVDEALRRFIGHIRDPGSTDDRARQASVALGRAELRAGRTLDALQAAYRVGARVAWRRFASAGDAAGVDHAVLARLAEAVFAYIDELSADSVDGYAQAQARQAGERERRRAQLLAALLGPTSEADAAALAGEVSWALPRRAATLACRTVRAGGIAQRVGPDVLAGPHGSLGCLVIPDADTAGRRERIRAAVGARAAAIGPVVPLEDLGRSWGLATAALPLARDGLLFAEEHLAALVVRAAAPVVREIADRRLAPLAELTPAARERMAETALAYIQQFGNAAAMARVLHLHPQTVRYRIGRLRELLGEDLDDPEARFELEAALRAR